jgi:hypothetical protein
MKAGKYEPYNNPGDQVDKKSELYAEMDAAIHAQPCSRAHSVSLLPLSFTVFETTVVGRLGNLGGAEACLYGHKAPRGVKQRGLKKSLFF